MQKSDSIINLAKALCQMQAELRPAPKDSDNPFFRSKYADLATVWETCRGPLTKNGLAVSQFASANEKNVTVTTLLLHVSGEWLSSDLTVQAKEATPQAVGSAITYARRYGLSALIGLSSEEDDDGAEASGTVVAKNGKPPVAMPQAKTTPSITPLQKVKEELKKAEKAFGEDGKDGFYGLLGSHGFEKVEDVDTVERGKNLLRDLAEAYKAIQQVRAEEKGGV